MTIGDDVTANLADAIDRACGYVAVVADATVIVEDQRPAAEAFDTACHGLLLTCTAAAILGGVAEVPPYVEARLLALIDDVKRSRDN